LAIEGLFAPVTARGPASAAVDDQAWLEALLEVEVALVRALARCGLAPSEAAEGVADAAQPDRFDTAALGLSSAAGGNPVIPLVKELSARIAPNHAAHVHRGATSQDVLDTAAMLVLRRALVALDHDLAQAGERLAQLAREHRVTPTVGRTLLQHAAPTTFGAKAAFHLHGLTRARATVQQILEGSLAAQLGGPVGTLATFGSHGTAVLTAFADELDLVEPQVTWHTERTRMADIAGALGMVAAVLGKIAGDLVLLAQSEVGEVSERAIGAQGGSSSLPHKRNPVASVAARAAALRAPGLVATILSATADHEHERAAGAWHAEWMPVRDLVVAVGTAAAWLRQALEGLEVSPQRMRANLEQQGGLLLSQRVSDALADRLGRDEAHQRVRATILSAAESQRAVRDALLDDPVIAEVLEPQELDTLLNPSTFIGSAEELIDRALTAWEQLHDAG